MSAKTEDIRNLVLVGHSGTGKTTLAEAVIFKGKAVTRLGKVDDGTSVSDFDDDEKERKVTINASILHTDWKEKRINMVDTPGYADFLGEAVSGLAAADLAVITMAASAGVEVTTSKMWERISTDNIPAVVVVTKMNSDNADLDKCLDELTENFGNKFVLAALPDTSGDKISKIFSTIQLDNVPDTLKETAQIQREALIERAVEADDDLMEKYLEGEELSAEELETAIRKAVISGMIVPVLCTAADREIGVDVFLDFIASYAPAPCDVTLPQAVKAGTEEAVELSGKADGPFVARVFKSVTDPFVGRLTYLRVYNGTLKADTQVYCPRTDKTYKAAQLFEIQGKNQEATPEAAPGAVIAIAKMDDVFASDSLCQKDNPITLEAIQFSTPMVSLAVEPKSRGDETKINEAINKLSAQDPTFKVERNQQTHEMVISGMGNLHLDVIIARLKRQFNVEVTTKIPRIPYLETITRGADAHYRHKKQSGGAGEFAEVWLKIEPRERGSGFEFESKVVGASIPNQFIPSCEKGIRQILVDGAIAGHPVVDVKAIVYDGKDHPVDSKDIAFQRAARMAFRMAVEQAKPCLLEPVVNLEVSIPSEFMGEINGDLSGRRGRIMGMDTIGKQQIIKASVPQAEVANYATELRSMTGGAGSYTLEFSHYDMVPGKIADGVIAAYKKSKE